MSVGSCCAVENVGSFLLDFVTISVHRRASAVVRSLSAPIGTVKVMGLGHDNCALCYPIEVDTVGPCKCVHRVYSNLPEVPLFPVVVATTVGAAGVECGVADVSVSVPTVPWSVHGVPHTVDRVIVCSSVRMVGPGRATGSPTAVVWVGRVLDKCDVVVVSRVRLCWLL